MRSSWCRAGDRHCGLCTAATPSMYHFLDRGPAGSIKREYNYVVRPLSCGGVVCRISASRQTSTSLVQGAFNDLSGAPVANAKVIATLVDTDTDYATATNSDGSYVLPNMRPGQYIVTAEAPSFKRTVRTGSSSSTVCHHVKIAGLNY